jgi:hypothetical protein
LNTFGESAFGKNSFIRETEVDEKLLTFKALFACKNTVVKTGLVECLVKFNVKDVMMFADVFLSRYRSGDERTYVQPCWRIPENSAVQELSKRLREFIGIVL